MGLRIRIMNWVGLILVFDFDYTMINNGGFLNFRLRFFYFTLSHDFWFNNFAEIQMKAFFIILTVKWDT